MKKLAKGKFHATKRRRGKPIGGYHVFARRKRGECGGTGVQKLQQIKAAWEAADAATKMECENEALKERVDCSWGAGGRLEEAGQLCSQDAMAGRG